MLPEIMFQPEGLIANTHVQSLMTSGPWRKRVVTQKAKGYLQRTKPEVWRADDGTRLLGYRNLPVQSNQNASDSDHGRSLVILIHGWEGSANSNYLLSAANTLDLAGLATFRLNLRDHGESHHLNVGLFHSCLLFEVLDVVAKIAYDWREKKGDVPVYLVGFSLGGNFTLRIAKRAAEVSLDLTHAIAISPVIRPVHVMDALEYGYFVYHRYFVKKWRKSLKIKQALFPKEYDFDDWFALKRLSQQTEWLIGHYTDFPNVTDYLEGYSVAGDYLAGMQTPTTVLTSTDDPIIPATDFQNLPVSDRLQVSMQKKGGHCGFIENWQMESWVERWLVQNLSDQSRVLG